jgi:hypothetical protein
MAWCSVKSTGTTLPSPLPSMLFNDIVSTTIFTQSRITEIRVTLNGKTYFLINIKRILVHTKWPQFFWTHSRRTKEYHKSDPINFRSGVKRASYLITVTILGYRDYKFSHFSCGTDIYHTISFTLTVSLKISENCGENVRWISENIRVKWIFCHSGSDTSHVLTQRPPRIKYGYDSKRSSQRQENYVNKLLHPMRHNLRNK